MQRTRKRGNAKSGTARHHLTGATGHEPHDGFCTHVFEAGHVKISSDEKRDDTRRRHIDEREHTWNDDSGPTLALQVEVMDEKELNRDHVKYGN